MNRIYKTRFVVKISFFANARRPCRRRKVAWECPTKIIPWSVSWHPMIVRQRLEWSLGVHVRLARVSCGATLPIPDCLQTVTSYQGHAGYNYIPTLASSPYSCLVPLPPWPTPSFRHRDLLAALRSLSLSLSLSCPLLFWRAVLIVKRRASQPSRS